MIINAKDINKARGLIEKAFKQDKKTKIIVKAQDDEFNRKILENKKVSVLLSPELTEEKDRLKQRSSGLNEFLCRTAAKNNIAIGINLNNLKNKQGKEKAILLSRIIQNIKLCKRTKTQIIIYPKIENKEQKNQAFSLLITLGASTSQAKTAV